MKKPFTYLQLYVLAILCEVGGAKRFTWTASLDRKSGMAQSREISFPPTGNSSTNADIAQRFLHYPLWLCKGSVTLGMLRAVDSQGTDIRLKGTGTSILKLGQPSRQGNVVQFPFEEGMMVAKTKSRENGYLAFCARDDGGIETSIVNYRPSLCGKNVPINAFRSFVYLRTQSLVHAYVMWRFHHYCRTADAHS